MSYKVQNTPPSTFSEDFWYILALGGLTGVGFGVKKTVEDQTNLECKKPVSYVVSSVVAGVCGAGGKALQTWTWNGAEAGFICGFFSGLFGAFVYDIPAMIRQIGKMIPKRNAWD